jgi:hypothetical protein
MKTVLKIIVLLALLALAWWASSGPIPTIVSKDPNIPLIVHY